jgi:hypothetical protein
VNWYIGTNGLEDPAASTFRAEDTSRFLRNNDAYLPTLKDVTSQKTVILTFATMITANPTFLKR